jgi:CIC family chloride channel protein
LKRLSDQRWFAASQGEMRQVGRLLAVYGLLGVVAGAWAVGFVETVEVLADWLRWPVDRHAPFRTAWPEGVGWLAVVLPAAGGLVVGVVCSRFAPEAMGPGSGHVIDAYLRHGGELRRRVPVMQTFASVVTLGTGGSGGVEGPVSHIAAGLGAWFGRVFGLTAAERRVLMMAGGAAGIGAVFNAPMASAIFTAEVLYAEMDIEHEVLVPAIIASTVAHASFGALRGQSPLAVPDVHFGHGAELLAYLALAAVLSLGALLFSVLFRRVRRTLGQGARYPLWIRPAVGGLGVGLVGLAVPQAMGAGYGIVDLAFGGVGAWALLGLALAKMLTTAFTAGSGGAGGLFAPSLVIGGALGGVVGHVTAAAAPGLGVSPGSFVVVGMAGFFAAVANAPLSTVIMVAELAGSYELIVPALWTCTLAWLLSRHVTLFDQQVPTRMDAPFRLSDMMGAVLHRIPVREALGDERPAHSSQAAFPILDPQTDRLLGVIDGRQLRRTLAESGVDTLLIAHDFQSPALVVRADETLFEATSRMAASGFDEVVVVEPDDPGQLVGLLSRRQVVNAYHRRMLERAPDAPAEADDPGGDTDLADAVARGGVLVDVEASTPDEAIAEMVRRADLPAGADREALLALLRAREALGSTGVGDGIALPHPHADDLGAIDRPRVVVGLLRAPVDWNAYDGKPVETVCMLLSPSGDTHLALLGALARALHDPTLRKMLAQRSAAKQIVAHLRQLDT